MPRFLAVTLFRLLCAGACCCAAGAALSGGEPPSAWRQLARQLEAEHFSQRCAAQEQLQAQPGVEATAWLSEVARVRSPEAATRAIEILERWMLEGSGEVADASDQALQGLSTDAPHNVAGLAAEVLETHEQLRERRAIARLTELGAKIDMGPDFAALAVQHNVAQVDPNWNGQAQLALQDRLIRGGEEQISREGVPQAVGAVFFPASWKGSPADLRHLGRLRGKTSFKVYVIRGSGVELNDVRAAVANLPAVDEPEERGPSLGITNVATMPYAQVGRVLEGGAADKAGIEPGDIITSIDGQSVDLFHEVIEKVAEYKAGKAIKIGVLRLGRSATVEAKLGDWTDVNTEASLWDPRMVNEQIMQRRFFFPMPANPDLDDDLRK
jgi:hypothetical protein